MKKTKKPGTLKTQRNTPNIRTWTEFRHHLNVEHAVGMETGVVEVEVLATVLERGIIMWVGKGGWISSSTLIGVRDMDAEVVSR